MAKLFGERIPTQLGGVVESSVVKWFQKFRSAGARARREAVFRGKDAIFEIAPEKLFHSRKKKKRQNVGRN